MQQPKNIKIQVWTDLYYLRLIGIWRPHEEAGAIPEEPSQDSETPYIDATKMNLPRYIVLSSVYEPREELMGFNPIATGIHPIPQDFLDDQTRQISYMFANDMGIFTPPTKAAAANFIAKQTNGYNMIKEIDREVRPATGSMSAKELRNSLNQYTDDELENIPVMIVGEHPNDANKRGLSVYEYSDKLTPDIKQYLTVTKLIPVYELENKPVSIVPIGDDHIENSLAPGTEISPLSMEVTAGAIALAETTAINQDVAATFDEMKKESPETPIDRVMILEEMLKKKDQELISAGLKSPIISTEKETIPEPVSPYFK